MTIRLNLYFANVLIFSLASFWKVASSPSLRATSPLSFSSSPKIAKSTFAAFKILTSDSKVKGILINIFGGIMKCDVIAQGTVDAVKEVGLEVPLVVRLEGTNVEEGKNIINNSGLNVIAADDLDDAAQKIVTAVGAI